MRSFARTAAARAIVRAGWVASIAALSVSFVVAAVIVSAPAEAASISGTVTGPDGAPLRAAFVQAVRPLYDEATTRFAAAFALLGK